MNSKICKLAAQLKIANDTDEEVNSLMSQYVAITKALYLLHQQNHWDAISHGNHLLFERLYEEVLEISDETAERVIGLCGDVKFGGFEEIALKFMPQEKTNDSLLKSSLALEEAYQQFSKKLYDTLKEKDFITLGLDDLIMGNASEGENRIYLLKQALKNNS